MKLSSLGYLTAKGFENIWKNKLMEFASFCVLLVSILLVGMSVLLYMNLNSIIGSIEDKNEVIVYLDEDATDMDVVELGTALMQMDNISEVTFYSKEEAFEDLKDDMEDYEVLFDSLGDDNPLIDSYRIQIEDISIISTTLAEIGELDNIYTIQAPMDFVDILTDFQQIVSVVFGVVIVALVIISVIIVSNATKASVYARRDEIQIMKYVGATNAFIRIPFFVEGVVIGLLAGIAAYIITWLSYDALVSLITEQTDMLSVIGMGSIIPFDDVRWWVLLSYLLAGVLFGTLGSMISMRKHLNV